MTTTPKTNADPPTKPNKPPRAREVIEPFNKFRVDSSPTEVVIREPTFGAITRKDALMLAAFLALHANNVDDGTTLGDIDDFVAAVVDSKPGQTVNLDERLALENTELRAKVATLTEQNAALMTPTNPGSAEETPEERRLRGELQSSLEREAKSEITIKTLNDDLEKLRARIKSV